MTKDLYALLPCPIKTAMEGEFSEYLDRIKKEGNCEFNYLIEANANKSMAKHNFIDDYINLDDIPSIVISSGINDLYGKEFYTKFIKKNMFNGTISKMYQENLSMDFAKDPYKSYNIIGMNILVMVVDLTKIGNRKIPSSFLDILDESFKKSLAIRGQNKKYCETTLLTVFKEYGMGGIRRLKENVIRGYHPAEMVKMAGRNLDEAPAVSIMPYYYANIISNKNNIKIVWPKEGAIVSPITMIIKKDSEENLKDIIEFFIGEQSQRLFSKAHFITLNDGKYNEEFKNKKFYWPGWDYIYANDIKKIMCGLNAEFNT